VGIRLDLELTPRSTAAQAWLDTRIDAQAALEALVTGGDDYELVMTVAPKDEAAVKREADRLHLRLTRVGEVTQGSGVSVRYLGQALEIGRTGWTHDRGLRSD
jgi:thiamine-monophosphate kinase